MCDALDSFDFSTAEEGNLAKMMSSVINFLSRAEEHMAGVVRELSFKSACSSTQSSGQVTPDLTSTPVSSKKQETSPKPSGCPIGAQVEHHANFLDDECLEQVKEELHHLTYLKTGTK